MRDEMTIGHIVDLLAEEAEAEYRDLLDNDPVGFGPMTPTQAAEGVADAYALMLAEVGTRLRSLLATIAANEGA